MALSKIIKEGLKTTAKRGRKGRYAKAAATRKKTMEAKAIAEGRTPKPKKTVMKPGSARRKAETTPKGALSDLTAKQKAERTRLINDIKKEMEIKRKGITPKPRGKRMVSTVERKPDEKLTDLSLNMVPASLIQLDPSLKGYSRKAIRRLVQTGQAKIVKKGNKFEVKSTGRYSPPASEIGKTMGVGSSTQDILTKKGADLTNVPDIRKARGTGRKMPSLRQRIEKAKRAGEPTSAKELAERKQELSSPKTLSSAQSMNQARSQVKKEQQNAMKQLDNKAAEQKREISEAQKKGTITKENADNLKQKIDESFDKAKQETMEKLRGTVHSKARSIKSDPLQYTYRKKGGKVGSRPRGCGAAMRGYGKAMKGSK